MCISISSSRYAPYRASSRGQRPLIPPEALRGQCRYALGLVWQVCGAAAGAMGVRLAGQLPEVPFDVDIEAADHHNARDAPAGCHPTYPKLHLPLGYLARLAPGYLGAPCKASLPPPGGHSRITALRRAPPRAAPLRRRPPPRALPAPFTGDGAGRRNPAVSSPKGLPVSAASGDGTRGPRGRRDFIKAPRVAGRRSTSAFSICRMSAATHRLVASRVFVRFCA